MKRTSKQALALLLSALLVMTALSALLFTAAAEAGVPYLDANGNDQTAADATALTEDMTTLPAGWYVLSASFTTATRITCAGDVHLILKTGSTLTAEKGIAVNEGSSLTVYGQPNGNGKLVVANAANHYAGIGGDDEQSSGVITINGGRLDITGGRYAAGIGGGYNGSGTVIINGGFVEAAGGYGGAAIGGGDKGFGAPKTTGTVTVNGGDITAYGGDSAAGLGGRCDGVVTINGGTVDAYSGTNAAAIGGGVGYDGTVTINGGVVDTSVGSYAACIGGGQRGNGIVAINGGQVTATGGDYGIGGGSNSSAENCPITLSWSAPDDSLEACNYNGTVRLVRAFNNGSEVLPVGEVTDHTLIDGMVLTPSASQLYSVTVAPSENGTVIPTLDGTSAAIAFACAGEVIRLTGTPDAGYALASLRVQTAGGSDVAVTDKTFVMPAGDVVVSAEFLQTTYVARQEPYVDADGAYIFGSVAHYIVGEKKYAVNEDGSIGEELTDVSFSYFDFTLRSDDTYQVDYYTGPVDTLTELVIPKTYNGKPITVIGTSDSSGFLADNSSEGKSQFVLVLNENIKTIQSFSFYATWVTEVTGDTSSLNTLGAYAFSWANNPGGNALRMKLDYPGEVRWTGSGVFNHMNVTFVLKHATTVAFRGSDGPTSVAYEFTDAHPYGDAVWSWAEDYSTASVSFTCTDERCNHTETVDAVMTHEIEDGMIIYTATAEFEGRTYTYTNRMPTLLQVISYVDANGEPQTAEALPLTGSETELTAGWYAVTDSVAFDHNLKVRGEVNLILCDGQTLTLNNHFNALQGATAAADETVNLYGQTAQTGTIKGGGTATMSIVYNCNLYGGCADAFNLAGFNVGIFGGTTTLNVVQAGNDGGVITLGCRDESSSIRVNAYSGTVKIADGQTLTDGSATYSGTLTSEQVSAIWQKTLRRVQMPDPITVVAHSLSLNGDIGVNFYVDIPDVTEAAYAEYTVDGQTVTVPVDLTKYTVKDGKTLYKFTCNVVAAQLDTEITGAIYNGDQVSDPISYSVHAYLTEAMTNPVTAGNEKLMALMSSLATYGYYANILNDYNPDFTQHALFNDAPMAAVTAESLAAAAAQIENTETGVVYYGSSLVLRSKTAIRHYFSLPAGKTLDDFTFTCDGKTLTPKPNGSYYYVEIPDIASAKLGTAYVVTVTDANGNTVNTWAYSAMSYAYKALTLENADQALTDAAKALAVYYGAAQQYFGA